MMAAASNSLRVMLSSLDFPRRCRAQCRIWLRNSLVRSCCGLSKNAFGAFDSTIWPSSMNTMRLATWRAKPISWVTHSMVMPDSASCTMVSSTSLTISGSSAEVGSSNSMSLGFMQSARAIATRCCWPPESWPGYFPACSGILTRLRYVIATSSAWRLGILRTQIGASVRFSSTVRCGNRLKCWNTMPTSRRTSSIFLRSLVSSMPSTTMRPCWCSSRRLMQRIMVDLPEPDGPQITMRSPLATRRLMSRSTWNSPNHLCTPASSTATSVLDGAGFSAISPSSCSPCRLSPLSLVTSGKPRLDHAGVARHAVAEDQIEDRGEGIAAGAGHRRRPGRIGPRRLEGLEEIEDADDEHQRGVLEQRDGGIDDVGDGDAQRLRQHDQPHGPPVAEPDRGGGFDLAF